MVQEMVGKDSANVGKAKALKAKWIKMDQGKFRTIVCLIPPQHYISRSMLNEN